MTIDNDEILHSSYTIVRNDRESRGGGVMLGIKTGLLKPVRETKPGHDLEIVLVELKTISDTNILIFFCYRLPSADRVWMENFQNFLNDVCSCHLKIVLAGYFNLPRASWNLHEISVGVNQTKFIEILDDFYMEQTNNS